MTERVPPSTGSELAGAAQRRPQASDEAPRIADPGKEARAASGVPVVPGFDGYRAFAILGIVLWHVLLAAGMAINGDSLPKVLLRGTLPRFVDVLFIVSGFVVFLPTVAEGGRFGSVGAYAIRRAARILPAYWVAVAVALGAFAIFGSQAAFPSFGSIASHVTGLHGPRWLFDHGFQIGFASGTPLHLMGQVWTLSLELGFYVILPFVAVGYYRRPWIGLAVAAAIEVAWKEAFKHLSFIDSVLGLHPSGTTRLGLDFASTVQLPNWAFSFAMGMTGAWVYVRLRSAGDRGLLQQRAALVAGGAATLLAVCAYLIGRAGSVGGSPLAALGYTASLGTAMVALALARARVQRVFANPLARRLGDISYGIFLAHVPIIWFATTQMSLPGGGGLAATATWAAIVFPSSIVYGYLSARFVEQPVRRWAHRFGRRAQASARPAPAGARG